MFICFVAPPDPLEIIVLSQSDVLFLWSNDEQLYLRCFMPLSLSIRNIYWSAGTLLTLATDGTLHTGSMQKQKANTSANRNFVEEFIEQKSKRHVDISETQKCVINLKRVPNIDRITNVSVDQRCESFVVLQENSKRYLTIPVLDDDPINFKTLMHDTTEFDLLHDIVFHVSEPCTSIFIIIHSHSKPFSFYRLRMRHFRRINILYFHEPKDYVILFSNMKTNISI